MVDLQPPCEGKHARWLELSMSFWHSVETRPLTLRSVLCTQLPCALLCALGKLCAVENPKSKGTRADLCSAHGKLSQQWHRSSNVISTTSLPYIGGCSKERQRQETGDWARLTPADVAVQDASCVEVGKAEGHLPGSQQNCLPARRRLLGGRLPEAALVHSILCHSRRRRIIAVPVNARLIWKSPVLYKNKPEPKALQT